ncbi:MAG: ORF6N domain-containing protein [bacterium]|nr:ORF6N domain-containing protein [bacterium]
MRKKTVLSLVPVERIERYIFLIRGQKVMLDSDLAELYGVSTGALNQAVVRNLSRFPRDFMFQLNEKETVSLISQIVISKKGRGGRRHYPYVFTEQGIAMLSSVLRSERAVQVNIAIMRTFVHLRELLVSHKDLARKLEEMEKKYDKRFQIVFEAIRKLMEAPVAEPSRPIGFISGKPK